MSDHTPLEQEQALIIHDLRMQLEDAEELLSALRRGEVDALVVKPGERPQIWSLNGVDHVYRVLFETLNEGALTLDSDGTILYSNTQFANLIGLPLQRVLGTPFVDYVLPADADLFEMLLRRGLRRSSKGELSLQRAGGSPVPVMLSFNAVEIEQVGMTATVVVSDLTELKGVQVALAEANDHLEARVEARTAELRAEIRRRETLEEELSRRAEELAEADRRKNEFLAMLGHELRNPLAPITNAVEMLRIRCGDHPEVERARVIIERQIRHMARLVDDLLDVSRITRGLVDLRREEVDLKATVEAAVNACRPAYESAGHRLAVSLPAEPCWILGDQTRLEQVVVNLLSNAAKYTPPGGCIAVSLELDAPLGTKERLVSEDDSRLLQTRERLRDREIEGPRVPEVSPSLHRSISQSSRSEEPRTWARIIVRDTGRGIPKEKLPHVFDLFTQVDAPLDRSLGGLGIGLTIVRSLVQLHGGTVEARSDGDGHGATFTVCLPVIPDHAAARSRPEAGRSAAGNRTLRVLVVEDNIDAAETLADLLTIWGHEVKLAFHGQDAVIVAAEMKPDVVILDIGLPGESGYEVAARLRDDGGPSTVDRRPSTVDGRSSPFLIALTGYGQEADRRRAQAAGFDVHLTKPINPEQLRGLLAGVSGEW